MSKRQFTDELLCNNEVLQLLDTHGLLSHSNEYVDPTKALFENKAKPSDKKIPNKNIQFTNDQKQFTLAAVQITEIQKNPEQALKDSFAAFDSDYQAMTTAGQQMLLHTTQILIDKENFKGVTVELAPEFINNTRQENYNFATKTVSICFYPFSEDTLLYHSLKPTQALLHELTHGVDYALDMSSYKSVLDYLAKQESVHLVPILETSADLLDNSKALKKKYIQPMYTMINDAYEPLKEHYTVQGVDDEIALKPYIVTAIGDYKESKKVWTDSGELVYASGLAEFLTFETEQLSKCIAFSNTAEEFDTKYKAALKQNLASIKKVTYATDPALTVAELRYASLGLIKAATEVHIYEIAKSSVLKPYMEEATKIFDTLECDLFKDTIQSVLMTCSSPKLSENQAKAVVSGIIDGLGKQVIGDNASKEFVLPDEKIIDKKIIKYRINEQNEQSELELETSTAFDMDNMPLISIPPALLFPNLKKINLFILEPEVSPKPDKNKDDTNTKKRQNFDSFEDKRPKKKLKVSSEITPQSPEITQSPADSETQQVISTNKRKFEAKPGISTGTAQPLNPVFQDSEIVSGPAFKKLKVEKALQKQEDESLPPPITSPAIPTQSPEISPEIADLATNIGRGLLSVGNREKPTTPEREKSPPVQPTPPAKEEKTNTTHQDKLNQKRQEGDSNKQIDR